MRTSVLKSTSVVGTQWRLDAPRRLSRPFRSKRDWIELHDGRVVDKAALEDAGEGDGPWQMTVSENACGSLGLSHRTDPCLFLVSIPQNTGCTARTCAGADVPLHLVKPLGFDTDSKKCGTGSKTVRPNRLVGRLKRGGLDFWPYVVVKLHDSWEAFVQYYHRQEGTKRMIGFSKYGKNNFWEPEFRYQMGDWLIFGSETTGLPPEAHEEISRNGALLKIPMPGKHVRCLNLSVSAGIGLYEAKRQLEGRPCRETTQDLHQTVKDQ